MGARVRGGRAAAAPGLLDAGDVGAWTGTGCSTHYRFLLSRIGSSAEFADLLWEVAAELGTSHAYVMNTTVFTARTSARGAARGAARRGRGSRAPDGRWLVERVLPGESSDPRARSPLAAPGRRRAGAGDEILEVDGRPVDPVHGPWPALAGTAGKPVELTIRPPTRPWSRGRPRSPTPTADSDSDSDSDSSPTSTEDHTDNPDSADHDSSGDPPAPNDPTTAAGAARR